MRIPHAALPVVRLLALVAFGLVCALIFGYLWVNSGGKLPLVSKDGYRISLDLPRVSNLVYDSDVMVAGVKVGKVADLHVDGGQARVTMQLDSGAPMHQGAIVQVRQKTLVNESFLEITDGTGPALPDGASLPQGAGRPAVELNDLLVSLDPGTRTALASSVRSLGAATQGSRQSIDQALRGLGDLGNQGKDVLDALAAQTPDLEALTGNAATVLAALNTRQGAIAQLVTDANQLTAATSAGSGDIEAVIRKLPGVLDSAKNASAGLSTLSSALQPVAGDLRDAAPSLSAALRELPGTTADLRGLLPTLDGVLGKAPDTLNRVPAVAGDLDQLIPSAQVALRDLNPMLAYVQPYGKDIAAMFANWASVLATGDVNGKAYRVFFVINEQSLTGNPLNLNVGPLNKRNPYPGAGQLNTPGPWAGQYPRVQPDEPPK